MLSLYALKILSLLVYPEGLEPPTCCLEGSCSIQLSYGQCPAVGPDGQKAHTVGLLF